MPVSSISCTGETYSAKCIAQVAANAGFNKSESMLATATAVALAESSGRTKVVNSIGCCVGLWQINYKVHGLTKTAMQDPAQNAAAAFKISGSGTNWNPWTVYKTGAYKIYMPTATAAAKAIRANSGSSGGQSLADDIVDFGDPFGISDPVTEAAVSFFQPIAAVKDWISDRNNIFRIVKVMSGVGLIAIGAVVVAKPIVGSVASGAVGVVAKGLKK